MSGSMLVFPELEASAYCGHCLQPSFACSGGLGCSGNGEDLVLLGLPALPASPTTIEKIVRWAGICRLAHPRVSQFDGCRFTRDMVDRNLIFTLALERWRLCRMAEDHAAKLEEASEAARLPALFAAGHISGTHQGKLCTLQAMCEEAMHKLVDGSWASMSPLDVALCQNAFQTSDPSRYPLGDPALQLVYDVIGVLTAVQRWAFSPRGWHLRLDGSHLSRRHHPAPAYSLGAPSPAKLTATSDGALAHSRSYPHPTISTCGDSAGGHSPRSNDSPHWEAASPGGNFMSSQDLGCCQDVMAHEQDISVLPAMSL